MNHLDDEIFTFLNKLTCQQKIEIFKRFAYFQWASVPDSVSRNIEEATTSQFIKRISELEIACEAKNNP